MMDPRNSLVFDFARMVLEIFPKTMVMENVPEIVNMITPEGLPVIDTLTKILESGDFGYADRLKKILMASSGTGIAIRRGKNDSDKAKIRKRSPKRKKKDEQQLALL